MSRDSTGCSSQGVRTALADVSNRPRKRTLSMVSGDTGMNLGDEYDKDCDGKEGDFHFVKHICLEVENLVRGRCKSEYKGSINENILLPLEVEYSDAPRIATIGTRSAQENPTPLVFNIAAEIKEPFRLSDGSLEVGDAFRESIVSSISMPLSPVFGNSQDEDGKIASGVSCGNLVEVPAYELCKTDGKMYSETHNLASKHPESFQSQRVLETHNLKPFELGRCTKIKDVSSSNPCATFDRIKSCSCPFCSKAAYIWSDLHYQDIKGRIAALKKSKKEASILVQKSCRNNKPETLGHGSFNKSSNLESDLNSQWRSLYLHMEDIFTRESSHLQTSFLALRDLRESCKTSLENTIGMTLKK